MSGPSPTAQQAAALAARCSPVVLGAGAGCGKTTVLVNRFLDQLDPQLGGSPLGKVVAITFTKAAAAEMRARLRKGCADRAAAAVGADAGHWAAVTRELDTARVSTIHGFCGGILRSFAVEAGLDPAFGELEPDAAPRRRAAVTARYLRDGLLAGDADCERFVAWYGYADACGRLTELASRRDGPADETPPAFGDLSDTHAEAVAASWAEAEANARPERVREFLASAAVRDVREALAAATPDGPAAEKTLSVLDGLEKLERDPTATDLSETLGAVRKAAGVQGAGVKKGFGDAYEAVRDAFGNLRKAIDKAVVMLAPPAQDGRVAEEASLISLCAARLVRAIDVEFDKSLAAAGLVAVDELIGRAERLLSENASVRRRVAGGIDLLMVDEFQDTDPRQATLVRLITEADVADPPRLFVVGDHQQSIYRFRKADPTVFRDLREAAPPAGRLVLSENFRSRPEILGFVNHLFADGMEGGYEPLTAGTASPPPDPDDREDIGQPTCVESICSPVAGDAETRREAEAVAVTRHLVRLFDDGVPRVRTRDADGRPALRPIEHGDICLLCRTHAGFKAYERAFEAAGLPYQVVGGKAFYAQQEVLDVAMLCGWLADAGDTASLIGVLRSPMFGFDDETLLALRADRGSVAGGLFGETPPPEPLNDGQADRVLAARAILTELREQKDTLTARALLKLAFERTGFDASLLFEFLGRRKLANLAKLLEIAADHDRTEAAPLATLSAALREAVLDEPTEPLAPVQNSETGVITFMTVHQSKGLEFPVVIVADMEWTPRAHPATVAWSRSLGPLLKLPDDVAENGRHAAWDLHAEEERRGDEAEELRKLYVATTRAEDRLILAGTPEAGRNGGRPKSPWMRRLAERFDLETGLAAVGEGPPLHIVPPVEGEPPIATSATSAAKADLTRLADLIEQAEPAGDGYLPPLPVTRTEFSVTEVVETLAGGSHDPSERGADRAAFRDDARRFGIAVHDALERLPTADDEIDDWVAAADGEGLAPARVAELRALLRHFADSEYGTELRSLASTREAELVVPWGDGRTLFGRVDAVFKLPEGRLRVVDYKVPSSDFVDGEDEAGLLDRYAGQLAIYALGLRSATTGLTVREAAEADGIDIEAELVVPGPSVRRIAVDVSTASLAAWVGRIDDALAALGGGGQ